MKRFDLGFYIPVYPDDIDRMKGHINVLNDLGINTIGTDGFCGWQDAGKTQPIADLIKGNDVNLHSFHAPFGLMFPAKDKREQSLADNRRIIDVAASWGAKNIVWHARWFRAYSGDTHFAPTEVMDKMLQAEIDDLMAAVLPATCEYAANFNININIENLPLFKWGRDCYDLLQFINSMSIPNLGFIYDIGHAWCSDIEPSAVITEAGKLLNDTHFHDNFGVRNYDLSKIATCADVPGLDLHLPPGLGTINWVDVVRALRGINYSHPVVFEGPHLKGHPETGSLKQFRRTVELTINNWRAYEELAEHCQS